jgi:CubicO group peptidase (beta-lactamase class C family)
MSTPAPGAAPLPPDASATVIDANLLAPPIDARLQASPAPAGATTWAGYYAQHLSNVMGYAWAVGQNGKLVESGAVGSARSANSPSPESWSTDVICNLASVSKTVAAVAIMTQVQSRGWSLLDEPAWNYLSQRYTSVTPGAGVTNVSIGELLTMMSGLVVDGALNPATGQTVDQYLEAYLQQRTVNQPGHFYAYSNLNFTILQVIYEILVGAAPGSFADVVAAKILKPMGVDLSAFTAIPPADAALSYSSGSDTSQGYAWPVLQFVGPGGWLASANQLMNYLNGVRKMKVLTAEATDLMVTGHFGWYPYVGANGIYYHHNGGLTTGKPASEGISTGVIRLTNGFDAVLLVNSPVAGIISIMAGAFDATR